MPMTKPSEIRHKACSMISMVNRLMFKLCSIALLVMLSSLMVCNPYALAASGKTQGVRSYLYNGNPEQAVKTAHLLLADAKISNKDRQILFGLIVEAETMMTRVKHYEDVSAAVKATEDLIKEFPRTTREPTLRWGIIQLYWNQNKLEEVFALINNLKTQFPQSKEAKESWLMLGKTYYLNKNYAEARNAFLRYSVFVSSSSRNGREAQLWTALIDYEEKRFQQALSAMNKVFNKTKTLITEQESIYARYILLLDIQNNKKEALKQTNNFIKSYKTSRHASEIRLLHADLMANLPNIKAEEITREYRKLAEIEADTVVGRKAFMRKMMLQMKDKTLYRDIKPVIIALKRIANRNQLSEIEDEAFLLEGKLWERVTNLDPQHAPSKAEEAALTLFTRASSSVNPRIAKRAKQAGDKAFKRQIQSLISQKRWLHTVSRWEKFPNFRPSHNDAAKLRYDVAHGLRLLMEYEQAESILKELHDQADGSVWGEKVMLERARLWQDRGDPEGVSKVMRWLDRHEYTLYRPEMLVLVANMQMQDKDAVAAAHTLKFVTPEDIAPDAQAEYWNVKALTSEALLRWHIAASAWRMYAKQDIDNVDQALLNQANALFKGNDFSPAERLYAKTTKALQSPAWQYRYSICQLKSGKWKQALDRLEGLKYNPDAGIYASMASLTMAEREADRLLEENK
ncbi:MAG: hypothetical protein R8M45_01155 [Ghiorsea sp.]